MKCWDGYERVPGTIEGTKGSCRKSTRKSPVKKRTKAPIKRKYYKSPKRCNNSSKKRRKSKKTSIKRRKSKKTSVKKRKSRKTSVKKRKSKKTSVKKRKSRKISIKKRKYKKTSMKKRKYKKKTESLYLVTSTKDGPCFRHISPSIEKSDELETTNTVDTEANSQAVKKLEMIESLLADDPKCAIYMKNPYLLIPYEEKKELQAKLIGKISAGENITIAEENALEELDKAIKVDPVEVKMKEDAQAKWNKKYMEDGDDGQPSQGKFWYEKINQFVLPTRFISYSMDAAKRRSKYENIYRANGIFEKTQRKIWLEKFLNLCKKEEEAKELRTKKKNLEENIELYTGKIQNTSKTTDIDEFKKQLDADNVTLRSNAGILQDVYSGMRTNNNELQFSKEESESLNIYWQCPMNVLLPDNKDTVPGYAAARENNELIFRNFDIESLEKCTVEEVKKLRPNGMLFSGENEASSDCHIAKEAYKLKILAANMTLNPLIIFKCIEPQIDEYNARAVPLPNKIAGGPLFVGEKAGITIAGFAIRKKLNNSTRFPTDGMAKCELLALYYFLTNVASPVNNAGMDIVYSTISSLIPVDDGEDDDFRDPGNIIEKINSTANFMRSPDTITLQRDIDLFYRALYLTMTPPWVEEDPVTERMRQTELIEQGLKTSDEQFLEYYKIEQENRNIEEASSVIKAAKTVLEGIGVLQSGKHYQEIIQRSTGEIDKLTVAKDKTGVSASLKKEAAELIKQFKNRLGSSQVKVDAGQNVEYVSKEPPNPRGVPGLVAALKGQRGSPTLKPLGRPPKPSHESTRYKNMAVKNKIDRRKN